MKPNMELFFPIDVPPEIRPFVRRILSVNSEDTIDTVISPGPTGYQYFIWVVRGELIQEKGGSEVYSNNSLFLAGQLKDHPIDIRYTGKVVVLLIEFTALGCFELFGISGRSALNKAPKVTSLGSEPAEFERSLMSRSSSLKVNDISSRCQLICSMLEARIDQLHALPRYLYSALDGIESKNGAVTLNELVEKVGISRRQFARKFSHVVGVSPKYFCRVLQMNKAMEGLVANDKTILSEIANQAGYFDESHLIHAVQEFFGLPAAQLVDQEHPAVVKVHSSSRKA